MALDSDDGQAIEVQIHRPVRGETTVVARCALGLPVAVRVAPILDDGTPFPTLYWLTCPLACRRVARIESGGGVSAYAERAAGDEPFGIRLGRAHAEYEAERDALLGQMESSGSVAAPGGGVGGVRKASSIKCLHAHLAHTLGGGDNPVGSEIMARVMPLNCEVPCVAGGASNRSWREPTLPDLDERPPVRMSAIDIGTNSTRLLVADVGTEYTPIEREMRITRLGYKVDATGVLDSQAIERTVETVAEYARIAAGLGVVGMRIAATSACRDAANRDAFFDRVREVSGVDPEILTGEEEAATAFLGAVSGLSDEGPYALVDIGGGSTEIVLGRADMGGTSGAGITTESSVSIDMGCVRITERFLKTDPPLESELAAAFGAVQAALAAAESEVDVHQAVQLIGVAGTVTTLAALSLGLETYDPAVTHHHLLQAGEVRRLYEELAQVPAAERTDRFGVTPGRADVIVAGAIILTAVLERWGFSEILVSETDILDGLVLSLAAAVADTGVGDEGAGDEGAGGSSRTGGERAG